MKRWLAVTAAFAAAVATWAAAPADAATAYRYWQYWKVTPGANSWSFAQVGPASRPAHGTVEGWRFGLSASGGDDPPRLPAAGLFEQICAPGPPPDGQKRVAVVIDYGSAADSPPGETPPGTTVKACITTAGSATGLAILSEVAAIRSCPSGLIGGINGYPRTECGDVVVQPKPSPTAKQTSPATAVTPGARAAADSEAADSSSGGNSSSRPPNPGDPAAREPGAATAGTPTGSEATPAPAAPAGADAATGTAQQADAAEPVSAYPTASRAPSDTGSPAGLLATLVLLSALLGGAAYARRRAR